MSLQDPASKMSKSDIDTGGCVCIMDKPEDIMRAFRRAVTDSETSVRYDEENKPGISNLMQIYAVAADKSFEQIEHEFNGRGYGDFKLAVGEAVVEMLRPFREEATRILTDKAYLEKVYREGAEKAAYAANRTLRKVYKKVGFVQK
jgi:tryptophanyl-tRNA synthetase